MDRNSIIGIVLIAAILILWGVLNQPTKLEQERIKRQKDSLELVRRIEMEKELEKQKEVTEIIDTVSSTETVKSEDLRKDLDDFAPLSTGVNDFYTIENNLIKLTVSTKGGRPYSVELKKYRTYDSLPLVLFSGDSTVFGYDFFYRNKQISTNELYFKTLASQNKNIVIDNSGSISVRLEVDEERYIEYEYTLHKGSYIVDFKTKLVGLPEITTRSPGILDLTWEIFTPQQEQGRQNENSYTSLYYRPYKEKVESFNPRSNKDLQLEEVPTKVEWIAFKDQFFSSVIIADDAFDNALLKSTKLPDDSKYLKNFRAEVGIPYTIGSDESFSFKFFFGPNKFSLLKKYKGTELEELVTLGRGIIRWINQYVIIVIFDWLSKYIGNYGIIILLLTIIIKIGLLPLTYRSYLSQAKMKVLKPQIDELNKKFPKGKEIEKQQATMALYKKAGASPFGGCLPQLLQFPILFAMFRFFPTSIELRQEGFLWAKDLSTYDSILTLPFKIPLGYGDHVSLFTILMTVTTILSIKITSQTTASSQQMPGMKGMMYIMPVMFMFMLNSFSAGLTYYYTLTNLITFGQNWLFNQFIDEEDLLKKMEARQSKPKKKSNFQKRLEDIAKQRGYNMPKK